MMGASIFGLFRGETEGEVPTEEKVENDIYAGVDFAKVLRLEHNKGFQEGYLAGQQNSPYRTRVANQRRELRRLNRQINALTKGMKIAKGEA